MGWYDAFRGDTARVNMSAMTDNTGSAAKSFGDAFKDIGKSMLDVEDARDVSALRKKQADQVDASMLKDAFMLETKKQDQEKKLIDDSLKSSVDNYKTKDEYDKKVGGLDYASPETKDYIKNHYQTKFNDEAVTTSVSGNYDSFNAFKEAEPTLVQNADGKTLAQIEKWYADKDTTAAEIAAKTKELKHQEALSKKEARIAKLNATKDDIKLNKDYIDVQRSINMDYGTLDENTGLVTIQKDKADIAAFEAKNARKQLLAGIRDVALIRENNIKAWNKMQEEKKPKIQKPPRDYLGALQKR